MSYCINYDKIPVKQSRVQKRLSARVLTACLVILFAAVIGIFPQVRLLLAQLIFPGFNAESARELEILAKQIGEGVPLGEALQSFCASIFSWMHG